MPQHQGGYRYEHKRIPAGHVLRRTVKSAGDGPGQAPDQGAKSQTQGQEAQEKRKKVDLEKDLP